MTTSVSRPQAHLGPGVRLDRAATQPAPRGARTFDSSTVRLAILTNQLAPYRVPVLRAIARRSGLELTCLVCVDREADRDWRVDPAGEPFRVLELGGPSVRLPRRGGGQRLLHLKYGVLPYLRRERPDLVIIGDASWTSYGAALACLALGLPYAWWSEVVPSTPLTGGPLRSLRRRCIRAADACLASGSAAREFLLSEGARDVVLAPNSAENPLLSALRDQVAATRVALRRRHDLAPEAFALLHVGQLIPRKNLHALIQAAAEVDRNERPLHLLLVGRGPERAALEAHADRLGYRRARFAGAVAGAALAEYYTMADGLALVSVDEPWGMVINEALLFGLPVLATPCVGAARDLIDAHTGVVVDDPSPAAIRNGLEGLRAGRFDRDRCRRRAELASPERCADGFLQIAARLSPAGAD